MNFVCACVFCPLLATSPVLRLVGILDASIASAEHDLMCRHLLVGLLPVVCVG